MSTNYGMSLVWRVLLGRSIYISMALAMQYLSMLFAETLPELAVSDLEKEELE